MCSLFMVHCSFLGLSLALWWCFPLCGVDFRSLQLDDRILVLFKFCDVFVVIRLCECHVHVGYSMSKVNFRCSHYIKNKLYCKWRKECVVSNEIVGCLINIMNSFCGYGYALGFGVVKRYIVVMDMNIHITILVYLVCSISVPFTLVLIWYIFQNLLWIVVGWKLID